MHIYLVPTEWLRAAIVELTLFTSPRKQPYKSTENIGQRICTYIRNSYTYGLLYSTGRDIRDAVGSPPIMSMQLKQEGLNVQQWATNVPWYTVAWTRRSAARPSHRMTGAGSGLAGGRGMVGHWCKSAMFVKHKCDRELNLSAAGKHRIPIFHWA